MKKKLIASAVAFAMLFTTAFCGIGTPVFAAGSGTDSVTEKPAPQDMTFYQDGDTGHIYTEDIDPGYSVKTTSKGLSPSRAYIPSFYPAGGIAEIKTYYPATRAQHPYGTCWAHAAAACAEFDMITDGHKTKYNTDFSEFQMAYFQYHTLNDRFGGLDGDTVTNTGTDTVSYNYKTITVPKYLTIGGNYIYAMMTAAQWKTFTSESSVPYSTVQNYPFTELSSGYASADQAKLTDVRFLDIKNDRTGVKQAIMNNGAVHISYHSEDYYYSTDQGITLFYDPNTEGTNHDVVIVGWDDSISRYRFPADRRPEGDGAWLVRNSWSTDDSSSSASTYFYMSYYDKSLYTIAYSSEYAPSNQYQYLYQYDGSISHGTLNTRGVANVFTAQGPDGAVSEELKAVMLSLTAQTNVNYKIEVYTGWQSAANPGQLYFAATTTGWTDKKGIYTIPLKSPVPLAPGEKYAVVVTALNGPVNFDLENSVNRTYKDNYGMTQNWFNATASLDAGESFIVKNGTWTDIYSQGWYTPSAGGYGNICLKAMTNKSYTKKYTVTYNMNGGVNNTANPSGYLSTDSGSVTLKNPTRSGYHFAGWYTDSGYRNKVTSINRNNKYNQTLYARWCSNSNAAKTKIYSYATMTSDGSYQTVCSSCGTVKAGGTSYKASSVKLNYTKMAYTGNNRSPVPVIKTSKGVKLKSGTDYTYKYNQSARKNTGRYSVTVTFKGKYKGSKTLWFTVVPKAPATASAKLHNFKGVTVTWAKATGATGYYVYYKKASAAAYKNYKLTKNRTVKFTNLAANTKYNFKIVPYYKNGKTNYKANGSKIVSATTLKKLKQPSITTTYDGRVSLNWEGINGATGYQVWWSSQKAGKYNQLCDYSSTYVGVTFSVGKNEQYWYKTRAYKKVGNKKIFGPWSDPKAYTLR